MLRPCLNVIERDKHSVESSISRGGGGIRWHGGLGHNRYEKRGGSGRLWEKLCAQVCEGIYINF